MTSSGLPDALDAGGIRSASGLQDVRVLRSCGSTNALLLTEASGRVALLLADHQSVGRGRRGRRWHSAPGTGLLMSLRHPVGRPLRELPGLALVAGVACVRALRSLGIGHAGLKWPNDILVAGAKLGGILVQTRVAGGRCEAVIGIGINWHAAPQLRAPRRSAVCVAAILERTPSRNSGAIALVRALLAALREFDERGFDAFRRDWEAAHAHAGRRVRVRLGNGRVVSGTAEGVGADGSLRLVTRHGLRAIHSGTVLSALSTTAARSA